MRWIDLRSVGQRQDPVVDRVVQHRGHLLARETYRTDEVRAAHIPDEQCVAREDLWRAFTVFRNDRDAFRRVAGRLSKGQSQMADVQRVTILHLARLEFSISPLTIHDLS